MFDLVVSFLFHYYSLRAIFGGLHGPLETDLASSFESSRTVPQYNRIMLDLSIPLIPDTQTVSRMFLEDAATINVIVLLLA